MQCLLSPLLNQDAEPVEPAPVSEPAESSSIYTEDKEPGKETDKEAKDVQPSWPDDWRAKMAGEDEKVLKQLERFQSPEALSKAYLAAQAKIRSGELKSTEPPKEDDEAGWKAWREERGIPQDAKDYDLPMMLDGNYEEMDDAGKQTVDMFRSAFHELNLDQGTAAKVMEVANTAATQQLERQAQQDAFNQEAIEDGLRVEWGAEYRSNIALNAKFMEDKLGDGWQQVIMARQPDGARLADNIQFAKLLNAAARAEGGTTLESGDTVIGKSAEARIEEIRTVMQSDYGRYKTEGLDKEYAKLIEARR